VEKVCESPKIWSGVIDAKQCVDVTVMKTDSTVFTPGQSLHLDVHLIKGNRLFERDVPQFSASQISRGLTLAIDLRASCFHKAGPMEYVVEPSCITPVETKGAKRGAK
jgi:hypothetical protein